MSSPNTIATPPVAPCAECGLRPRRKKNAGHWRILRLSWHLSIAIPSRRLAALEGNGSALDAGVGFFGFNQFGQAQQKADMFSPITPGATRNPQAPLGESAVAIPSRFKREIVLM